MTPDEIRRRADGEHAELLRALADVAEEVKRCNPHFHTYDMPDCRLCDAITRLDALKP